MKNLKQLFYLSTFLFLVIACEEQTDGEIKIGRNPVKTVDNTISTDFNANQFSSATEASLLKELKICNVNAPNDTDEDNPACSPKFFRFFPLAKNIPLKNGFILLVKAGVGGHPLRRILIFQREKGILVKLNGFNGNLIEQRPSKSGYNDIVVRFPDNIDNSLIYYNCLFQWKNGKYDYKHCEVIDEGIPRNVKAEFIDSMGVEIKKILDKNNMIF
ncbi:MAG: hypothetical protein KA734_09165 [Fluviicola sp.]|nr:hypothetical protein [Fluviicola sp.]